MSDVLEGKSYCRREFIVPFKPVLMSSCYISMHFFCLFCFCQSVKYFEKCDQFVCGDKLFLYYFINKAYLVCKISRMYHRIVFFFFVNLFNDIKLI